MTLSADRPVVAALRPSLGQADRSSDPVKADVRSVLVYSMGEISGDGLIKLPFLAALRHAFPAARISWCAAKGQTVYTTWLRPVVEGLLDEVITQGVVGLTAMDLFALRRPFGGARYEVVIDTQSNVRRSLVVRRAAGLFISPSANFRLSDRRPKFWPEPLVERLQTLLSLAAGESVPSRPVDLTGGRALEAARSLLPDGPTYVGLAPGAGGKERRWPLERYIALAADQRVKGRQAVFILGPAEADYVRPLRETCEGALFPQSDRRDGFSDIDGPLLSIALATRFAVAVASDAGPGHMMAAGGAPLVSLALYRRKAVKFRPAVEPLRLLIAEDYGSPDIAAIPLADVIARLEEILDPRP
jgi:ADP-heptose:LPS heptosyltransferase